MTPYTDANVTWHRPEDLHRQLRLHRALGYAEALIEKFDREKRPSEILAVHDQKGGLFVLWDKVPNDLERACIGQAWATYDGADCSEHFVMVEGKTDMSSYNWIWGDAI